MPCSRSSKQSLAEQIFIVSPSWNCITMKIKEVSKCNSRKTEGTWKRNNGGNGVEEEQRGYGIECSDG